LEETQPDHAISSAETSIKLPLHCVILKKRSRKRTTKRRNVVL